MGIRKGQRLENVDDHDRKSLDCLKQTVGRNVGSDDSAKEDSGERGEYSGEILRFLQEHLNLHKQTVDRIVYLKAWLVRAQKEMRNMLLETRGKRLHIT